MTLGKRIREARLAADLSIEQVGGRAGVSASTISRIETGRMKQPSHAVLTRIARALGFASVDDLAARTPLPPSAGSEEKSFDAAALSIAPGGRGLLTPEALDQVRQIIREEFERIFREREGRKES